MPVFACPKCPTQLKIPDGASGNVKCPKCGAIFPVTAPKPAAAFEVVDGALAPAPSPSKTAKAADDDDDFEVVDGKPAKKKKRARDDEDDDEDDRPRSKKKRRRDDDDDDDDDHLRKKKKKRRWSEDDWRPPTRKSGNGFGPAKTGALLIGIGAWLYMGVFGLRALCTLIEWTGTEPPRGLMVVAGLVGLSNWIVSLVGLGFCIAGPERARGMAIAATIVAVVHLVLSFVCFGNMENVSRVFGDYSNTASWAVMSTTLTALNSTLPLLMFQSKEFGGDFFVAFLAGGCELARLILIVLTLKGLARAARAGSTADRAGTAVMAAAGVCGGGILGDLLLKIVVSESGITRSVLHLVAAETLIMFLAYALMTLPLALLANDTKNALAYRA